MEAPKILTARCLSEVGRGVLDRFLEVLPRDGAFGDDCCCFGLRR